MLIKVYPSCCGGEKVIAVIEDAVRASGVEAEIQVVKDLAETAKAGIISTPTITVDGQTVVSGRVPKSSELAKALVASTAK